MRQAILIGLFAAMRLFGQQGAFSQFAATGDGQQLFFISPLALTGSTPVAQPPAQFTGNSAANLYKMGPGGIQLLSSSASAPSVSDDGSVVGFTDPNVSTTISGTTGCCSQEGKLLGPPPADLGPGSLQLSRNGRWALLTSSPNPYAAAAATLIGIGSGVNTPVPSPPVGVTSALASDGTVLVQQAATNALGLWRVGQFTPIVLGGPGTAARPLALSADAGTLIYSAFDIGPTTPPANFRLMARNLATGADTTVYTAAPVPGQYPGQPVFMGASDDGSVVLFWVLTPGQSSMPAYIGFTATGKAQPIPLPNGESAVDGTLSGSGNYAFLATTSGRILRIPLAAGVPGAAETLVPETAYLAPLGSPLSPGAYIPLMGTFSGTVQSLQGNLLLGNLPLAVLAVKPGEVDVQVPWEQPVGPANLRLTVPTGSQFEQDQTVFVSLFGPNFLMLSGGATSILGSIAVVRGDFSGLQTTQPKPGDVVIVYMTGLGPVQGSPVSGQAASVVPLYPIQDTLSCVFTPQTTPAQTLFAGLAPGLVGIYQVSFQMPNDPNTAPLNGMQCSLNGPSGGAGFSIGVIGVTLPPPAP